MGWELKIRIIFSMVLIIIGTPVSAELPPLLFGNMSTSSWTKDSQVDLHEWYKLYYWLRDCTKPFRNTSAAASEQEIYKEKHKVGYICTLYNVQDAIRITNLYQTTIEEYFEAYEKTAVLQSGNNTCVNFQYLQFIKNQHENLVEIKNKLVGADFYQKYFINILTLLTLVLGLVMDGTLLWIIARHREMRKGNMIILNLTVCDLLNLTIVLPIQYVLFKGGLTEELKYRLFLTLYAFQPTVCGSAVFSVLALSAQRYWAVSSSLSDSLRSYNFPRWSKVLAFFLVFWGAPIAITSILWTHQYLFLLTATVTIGVVFPCVVTVLNVLTSSKLITSAKKVPGEGIHAALVRSRYRSSRLVIVLSLTFWITHTPYYLGFVTLVITSKYRCNIDSATDAKLVISLVYNIFYMSAFLNPLSLCLLSRKFRFYFKRYICCFQKYNKQENHKDSKVLALQTSSSK